MPNTDDLLAQVRRTNELLTVLVKLQLAAVIEQELSDPKRKKLYELTGTEIPIGEIAKQVVMSPSVISGTWQRWEAAGLLVKDGRRYKRLF